MSAENKRNGLVKHPNGDKRWYRDGKWHRDDGPAIEYANGDKCWYRDGKLHRDDGPAMECANGDKYWCRDDERHRDSGPAVEFHDGRKEWWQSGTQISKEEFDRRIGKIISKAIAKGTLRSLAPPRAIRFNR